MMKSWYVLGNETFLCTSFLFRSMIFTLSPGVGPHDLTLTAKRKISQRHQKRSSPSHVCQQSTQTEGVMMRRTSSLKVINSSSSHSHRDCAIIDGEYYEEQALLYERLLKAEEVRWFFRNISNLLFFYSFLISHSMWLLFF